MNKENQYLMIDLRKVIDGCIRRIWVIIASMLLCGGLSLLYAMFFVTPLYKSSALLYVNNSSFSVGSTSFSISSSEISAAKSLVETYQVILKTRMTLDDVIRMGNLAYSYDELRNMIATESVNDTEVFSITVTCKDPHEAEHIANTIARVLPDKIAGIVEGSSVRVVDYAVVPTAKVSPSITRYTITGLLLGVLLSCGVIVLIEVTNDKIQSEDFLLENFSNTPLLASIPDILDDRLAGKYYYAKPDKASDQESGTKRRSRHESKH